VHITRCGAPSEIRSQGLMFIPFIFLGCYGLAYFVIALRYMGVRL
jgi:hypothetical protein